MITFLFLTAVCLGFWYFIALIDSYYEHKRRYIKEEHLKDFTFISFVIDEIKHAIK